MTKTLSRFKFHAKQIKLLKLIHGVYKYILAVGGSRSGKTTAIIKEMIGVAYRYPGSRQLIARFRFRAVKATIWNDTLKKELRRYPANTYKLNNTELIVRFVNGSEIILIGLDTPERIDKVLGAEYCRIFMNECSEIQYGVYLVLLTRLAQVIEGLENKMICDLNPSGLKHWTNMLFIKHIDPITKEPITNPEDYAHIFINPEDNKENLTSEYLHILENLPEDKKTRFYEGKYQKIQGGIYHRFDPEKHTIRFDAIPPCETYAVGVDLITYAAVLVGFAGQRIYCIDECGDDDEIEKLTAEEMNDLIWVKWAEYNPVLYLDHNLGEEGPMIFRRSVLADKGRGSVEYGINFINQFIEKDNFYLSDKCIRTQFDIENYRRNMETGQIISKGNHFGDAMRYGIVSHGKNIVTNIADVVEAAETYTPFNY